MGLVKNLETFGWKGQLDSAFVTAGESPSGSLDIGFFFGDK